MAIIKCREVDGTLTPSTIEFEPGDTIQFESHQPVYVLAGNTVATQALRSFNLSEISVQAKDGSVSVTIPVMADSGDPVTGPQKPKPSPVPHPPPGLADPRLPPPAGGSNVTPIIRPIKITVGR